MEKETELLNEFISVGVVQTSLHADAAWVDDGSGNWKDCVRMSLLEEKRARKEVRRYLASLQRSDAHPDIVLLPELSVPLGFEQRLRRAAESLESIIIAGLDYRIEGAHGRRAVSNEAIVIVPRRLNGRRIFRRTEVRRVGKTYAAPAEKRRLSSISGGAVSFIPHPTVWIFDGGSLGKFAVAICYDFMDLDRVVMYRNKIQNLFILSYNRDTTSFNHMAEAIARMVFCNVVVCNCGLFGGSLAVSPFRKPFRRIVYRHSGQELPNAQVIQLPLSSLHEHQQNGNVRDFKSLPPGFDLAVDLTEHEESL